MDLFFVRHAIAQEPAQGLADAERALTPDGGARFAAVVRGLERLGLAADRCWHSPWRRAAETAALLRPLVDEAAAEEPLLAVAPGPGLLERLAAEPPERRLVLVGHQPWLGELAAWLCLGDPGGTTGLRIRKGGLVWLRGEPQPAGMEIEAVLKPSLLRRV